MQFKSLPVLCLAMVGASALAQAKPPEPDYTFAFNVALTSDYRFRGISQSALDPALQGAVDFVHKSGFYLGVWASSIEWIKDAGGNSDAEIDIYGGYRGAWGDFGYDVGVLRYQYPSHKLPVSPNTTELYGAVTYGPVSAKYSHSVTNTFGFANSKNSGYLDITATFDLGSGWNLAPHVGRQWIDGRPGGVSNNQFSYTDYALTLNKDFGNGFVASLAAVGTNANRNLYITVPQGKFTGRDGAVLTLKYNF